MGIDESTRCFQRATKTLVGGVNSPVRAFRSVGGTPLFIREGRGSRLIDVDGNEYIDYVCSWGPLILGHAHPVVISTLQQALKRGTSYGAPTVQEIELSQLICSAFPSIQKVRLVSSGTEATMSAVRLARAYTDRTKIIKFDGCYHGHADMFLIRAGSGAITLGIPDSPGVPHSIVSDVISLPYNNIDALKSVFQNEGDSIAAVIVEPVAGNMGVVIPQQGFLERLRSLTRDYGALLIFDEVITGFRLMFGGAQNLYGIEPDLTTLGKIIGGGLPVGAFGGRPDIMALLAPEGPVYQAGTLSGNPLAVSAGIATLEFLRDHDPYNDLERRATFIADGLLHAASDVGIAVQVNQIGSMLTVYFTNCAVVDYETALTTDRDMYASLFHGMLNEGIYIPPSPFECWFLSVAHDDTDLERALRAFRKACKKND